MGYSSAFSSLPLHVGRRTINSRISHISMSAAAAKPGTGQNRMTDTAFTVPLVEKVTVPTSQGYEWKVKEEVLEVKKMNMQEKVKIAKPGLSMLDEIEKLAAEAREKGGAQNMDEDDIQWRLKWLGLFHRNKIVPGTFMWRLRIPNGIVTTKQWRAMAGVIAKYDTGTRDFWQPTGCADITTRMNMQLRGIRLEDLPEHWKSIRDVGIFSLQSGMDNVRNLVGNPIAGLDPEEIIDTRPYCEEFTDQLTNKGMGNPEYSNLPRKFNVCYVGSKDMYEHPHINDIAYLPATDSAGKMGWNIDVGGLLTGTLCEFAIPLDAWVPLEQHFDVGDAILTTFRDFGYRYNPRTKCRLMYLINDMGMDAFRAEVASRFQERTGSELQRASHNELVPKEWQRRELLGPHLQKDGENYWVGVRVPTGRLFADEMTALADIVDKCGSGEIRLTLEENLLIPNVPKGKLDECLAALAAQVPRLELNPGTILKGTVSCTGNQFCGFANVNTKGNAIKIAKALDARFEFPAGKDVRIHWTGCPNTCAQIQIGDIGLLGAKAKDSAGNKVEGVDVYVGGGIGQDSKLATLVKESVPIDESLEDVLAEILVNQFGAKPRTTPVAVGAGASATGGDEPDFLTKILSLFKVSA